jgi:putative acetyltransferase
LETMDNMYDAQGLYKRVGFELLTQPLGNTGHYSCPVQMIKNI